MEATKKWENKVLVIVLTAYLLALVVPIVVFQPEIEAAKIEIILGATSSVTAETMLHQIQSETTERVKAAKEERSDLGVALMCLSLFLFGGLMVIDL
ncbi:MAG: hypothetical protein NTZ49_01785 [Candidatus Parcubacteria bacterium]|nr:hypothetical protein [Candidatus Parcubacteria bacterium]